MLSSRLFWKIFAAYAVLTMISTSMLVAILNSRQRAIVEERVELRLRDSAVLLRDEITDVFEEGPSPALQLRLKRLGDQTDSRLTLVDNDGIVIGDSVEDPAEMENHRSRAELMQARTQEFGVSQRPSPTLGIPMMYVAMRVDHQQQTIGFVRVAITLEDLRDQMASVQRVILLTAVFVSLVGLALTYVVVGRIIRPLSTLTEAATAIAEGDVQQEVFITRQDELGTLADAFNSMSRELSNRISELDQTGKKFAENSERLEAVLGGMVEGVLAVDANEKILFANRAAHLLLELAPQEVVGGPIWETVRSPLILEVVRNALEDQVQKRVELELPRTQAIVELSATRLPGNPCPGIILVLYDVTELRRLETMRQQFVSNVSHELKTPLASIQAYAETLLEGAIDDPEHNRKFVKRIDEQSERLHALILDLLRLARLESDEDAFVLTDVSLRKATETCLCEHADFAAAKGVSLNANPEPQDAIVLADEEGLRTILDNLVENAVNYTPAGGQISVQWSCNETMAQLKVADTGVGIAEEDQARIFERFYRVDKARSREVGGTGLGLSIVKHLALEFGGSVEIFSEVSKGTTFTVHLPLAR